MSEDEKKKRLEYRKKRNLIIQVQTIIAVVLALAIAVFTLAFFRVNNEYHVGYSESSSVDYKVYLKDNDFYDEGYLGKDQAYIASLIDNVEANFNYGFNLDSSDVNFEGTYSLKAQILVTVKQTGKTLLKKDYPIKTNEPFTKTNNNYIKINEKVDINYVEYNDFAKNLETSYKLTGVESSLNLVFDVNVKGECNDFAKRTLSNHTTSLKIPLSQDLVDVKINASLPYAENDVIVCSKATDKKIITILLIASIILEVLVLIEFIIYIYATRNYDINYEIKVKRLVSSYKSYIQKILTKFNYDGYQVLKVDTFNEMLDIRDTVNLPILMYENVDKTCTSFIIPTNSNILYVHEIKVEDYDEIYATAVEPDEIYATTEVEPEEIVTTEDVNEETVEDTNNDLVSIEEYGNDDVLAHYNGERYDYSFLSKLHLTNEETRTYHNEILKFIRSYGVDVNTSWDKERIAVGRKTYAIMAFKGLKLTVSFALNLADYENTKYKFIDVSSVKKYAKTPCQMKITSLRKVAWVKQLLGDMFKADGIENQNIKVEIPRFIPKTKKRLIKEKLIKVQK